MSWLVWNQRDLDGGYVGNGVYVWKVRYDAIDGGNTIPTAVYKQGIVRSVEPELDCAVVK